MLGQCNCVSTLSVFIVALVGYDNVWIYFGLMFGFCLCCLVLFDVAKGGENLKSLG